MTVDSRRRTDVEWRRIELKWMTSLHGRRCGLAGSISIGLRPSDVRHHPSLAGLVVLAGSLYPIPSRTRPSNFPAPMVLSLKTWKSRSLPGLPRTETSSRSKTHAMREPRTKRKSRRGIAAAAFCISGQFIRALFAVVSVAWKMHRGDGRSAARTLRLHRERDHL